jgi:hypothetical protein
MAGVDWASGFLICARSEFVRERERPSSPGGGDLRRGERGQWGVVSPELDLDDGLEGRGARTVSVDDAGVSSGMLVDDRARCTIGAAWPGAAVELDKLEPRLGLASALLLRERKPGLTLAPEGVELRWCGRAGEASRDDSGDGELTALKGRCPASGYWRMGGGADESLAMGVVGSSSRVGVDVAGSALSSTPVMDWKPSRSSAAVGAVEVIVDVLCCNGPEHSWHPVRAPVRLRWLGLDSSEVREWAVKVDEAVAVMSTRRAAVGLSVQGGCGAQTTWAFEALQTTMYEV